MDTLPRLSPLVGGLRGAGILWRAKRQLSLTFGVIRGMKTFAIQAGPRPIPAMRDCLWPFVTVLTALATTLAFSSPEPASLGSAVSLPRLPLRALPEVVGDPGGEAWVRTRARAATGNRREEGETRLAMVPSPPPVEREAALPPFSEVSTPRPSIPGFENYTQRIPGSSVGIDMVAIPGGETTLGSPADEAGRDANDLAQRRVKAAPFWIGKTEITWPQFALYLRGRIGGPQWIDLATSEFIDLDGVSRPTSFPMPYSEGERAYRSLPATYMSRFCAEMYCRWLSKQTGHRFRLPTEEEWEHACRAGTTSAYHWGPGPDPAAEYAWYAASGQEEPQPVGKLKPNRLGLFDMAGNVAEWCASVRPDSLGVLRGGSVADPATHLRCAFRDVEKPVWHEAEVYPDSWRMAGYGPVGFRVVRELADDRRSPATPSVDSHRPVPDLYRDLCRECHGETGKGDTREGKQRKARDYSDPRVKATFKDRVWAVSIRDGVPGKTGEEMPGFRSKLSNREIWALVELMRGW